MHARCLAPYIGGNPEAKQTIHPNSQYHMYNKGSDAMRQFKKCSLCAVELETENLKRKAKVHQKDFSKQPGVPFLLLIPL